MRRKVNIKKLAYVTTAVALSIFVASPVFGGPASKFSATVSNVALVNKTAADGWTSVMTTYIKTPNKKDLLIGCSFETGLYTQTEVKSKHGKGDTAEATAAVYVKLVIDDDEKTYSVYPSYVIYDMRTQKLSAKLGGVIDSCKDTNGDGTITVADECEVSTEEINLILDTMAAHHYNFVVEDMTPGDHTVKVYVKVATSADAEEGSANAMAMVGRGSLTVEEVRAINDTDGIQFVD